MPAWPVTVERCSSLGPAIVGVVLPCGLYPQQKAFHIFRMTLFLDRPSMATLDHPWQPSTLSLKRAYPSYHQVLSCWLWRGVAVVGVEPKAHVE